MEIKFKLFSLLIKPQFLLFFLLVSSFIIKNARAQKPTLRVVSLLDSPNLMEVDTVIPSNYTKERYEGFSKDLAEKLSVDLDFNYNIYLALDKSFGKLNEQYGTWSGLIGELIDNKADVAIAQTTVNEKRASVVDFSTPFMQVQLGIVIYDPNADDEDDDEDEDDDDSDGHFVFLKPLTTVLWITFVLTTIIMVLLIFLVEKFVSAKIRGGVRPDIGFCDGFCQKVFGAPKSVAARILQVTFWLYLIIFISSYISNFAADRVMDSSRHEATLPINSFEDLLKQDDDFKFGIMRSGSTFQYFAQTQVPEYKKMYERMVEDGTLVENYAKGIERVRKEKGNFAFIMEGPAAKYAATRKPCNLAYVPAEFGPKRGYAIATRKDSPWSRKINLSVMKLKENGIIEDLENKWYEDFSECSHENEDEDFDIVHEHSPLSIEDMAGVFYFLLIGLIISIVAAFLEMRNATAKYK